MKKLSRKPARVTKSRSKHPIRGQSWNGSRNGAHGAPVFRYPKTELEALSQRYVELYDFAPIAYVSFDGVGRIAELNIAAANLFGRSRSLLTGRPFALGVARPDCQEFLLHLLKCRKGEARVETDLNLKSRKGALIPVHLTSTPAASFVRDGAVLYQTTIEDLRERKAAEESLRQSEERFRRYFELGLIGMAILSPTKSFIEVNDQLCLKLGYERRELLRMNWDKAGHPDDLAADSARIGRILAGKIDGYSADKRWLRRDGKVIDTTVSVKCVRHENGSVDYLLALVRDITAQKRAVEALRDSEQRRRLALEAARIFSWELDLTTGQVELSPNAEEVLGFELSSNPEVNAAFVHPEDRERVAAIIAGVQTSKRRFALEYRMISPKTSETIWVRVHGRRIGGSKPDQALRIVGVTQNITENKEAEERLRQSEEYSRAMVDQTTVGIGRTNLQGELLFVNRKLCQMLGYKRDELLGKTIHQITHPDDVEENATLFRQLALKGEPYQTEKRYCRKNGSFIWTSLSASALRDATRKPYAGVGIILDIEERKRAEVELREASALLEMRVTERTSELMAANEELANEIALRKRLEGEILGISDREQSSLGQDLHDSLCQRLAAIAFMARATAERLRSSKKVEPHEIDKIAELVNDSVGEARTIARGLHPVEVESTGLVTALATLVNQKHWAARCRLDADEEISIADPTVSLHLYRIAREAVINANKHAGAREIVVRMRASRKQIELSVTDDGVGIPDNMGSSPGMGFHIMNYRARSVGARLKIEPIKPHGTRVLCCLPRK